MSVKLYNFAPVLFVPLAVFSHIRRAFFPVPFLDWHMPIFSVVRKDISLGFARYTCFQAKKLSPAKGEYWKNVPYGENSKNTSKQTRKRKKKHLFMNGNSLNLKLRAKWTQQLLTLLGHEVHGGKDKTNSKETMCNARAWSQQCWKSCAYESSIVELRFGDHGMKEMIRVVS